MLIYFLTGNSLWVSVKANAVVSWHCSTVRTSSFFHSLTNSSYLSRSFSSSLVSIVTMPPTEEDLAWFRSTFHPIPKPRLPDDCVEYCLYIFNSRVNHSNDSEIRSRLREVQKYASELQKEWLKDYIWQRQGFGLETLTEDGDVGLLQLHGQSRIN